MMQTDVKSNRVTATGLVYGDRARVKGMYVVGGATAGTVVLQDGNGGTTLLTIDVPANAPGSNVFIPGEGILHQNSIYAVITNAAAATVFYG